MGTSSGFLGVLNNTVAACGGGVIALSLIHISVAGNTVMCHLLMGISPEKLGKAPFMPDEYFGRKFNPCLLYTSRCV